MSDLRTRLNQALAGELPLPRGHVIAEADRQRNLVLATALSALCNRSERDGEPLHTPSELLQPLP